jgi:hypothetical protein
MQKESFIVLCRSPFSLLLMKYTCRLRDVKTKVNSNESIAGIASKSRVWVSFFQYALIWSRLVGVSRWFISMEPIILRLMAQ